MPGGNAELVERGYEMFRRRDLEGIVGLFAEDCELVAYDPSPTSFRGPEGVRDFLGGIFDTFESFDFVVERMIEQGPQVLVLVRNRARLGTIEMDQPGAHLWTLREGLIQRAVVYQDPQEALRDTGLGAGGAEPGSQSSWG
ncbi:MAG: nuclear transport factor 2 family protein [Solirubrobacterales bacterium]